jgi:hypothetical protein
VLSRVQAGDIPGAVAQLAEHDVLDRQTSDVFKHRRDQAVDARRPPAMISAFQAALRSWGFKMFAADNITNSKKFRRASRARTRPTSARHRSPNPVVNTVAPTILLISRPSPRTRSRPILEFETEKSVNYMCNVVNVKRMSTSFQSASAAGLNYFDTLLVQPLAQQVGMSEDAAKQRIAMVEPDYLVALMTSHLPQADGLPQELKASWGDKSLPWGLMSLAGQARARDRRADHQVLLARRAPIPRPAARPARARQGVREHALARRARYASASRAHRDRSSVQARLAYQLATVEKDGDLGDKLVRSPSSGPRQHTPRPRSPSPRNWRTPYRRWGRGSSCAGGDRRVVATDVGRIHPACVVMA